MKETLLINLIGGPSVGKTTLATFLFVQMKLKSMNVEYVQEVAKPIVYLRKFDKLNNQLEISKQQFNNIYAYNKILDYIITDGSILHGLYFNQYNKNNISNKEEVEKFILKSHNKIKTLNILLKRPKNMVYEQEGRLENFEESIFIDEFLEKTLIKNNIEYITVEASIFNMIGVLDYIERYNK